MSWLGDLFNPGKGYDKAQEQLDKYYQQAQQFQQPYLQNAGGAGNSLMEMLAALQNPAALQNDWMKNYQESDYAKGLENETMDRGLNAAQAMGIGGSTPALRSITSAQQSIVGQERQKYLDDLMNKYMQAIGIGQNIYGTGANAAGNLSNQAMNMGQNSAEMAYGKQNAGANMLGNIFGTAGGIAAGALGGPIGGALGAGLAQRMKWSPAGSYNPTPGVR